MAETLTIALLASIAALLLLVLLRLRRMPLDLDHLDLEGRFMRLEKLDQLDRLKKLDHLERLEALRRLGELEKLTNLEALGDLPARLDRLETKLEALRPAADASAEPPPVEVRLEIADDLRDAVREAVRDLERDLKKILRVTGRTRAERVGTMIRLRLLEEGYTAIRITGGLPRTRSGRARVRVPVDAERDGLRFRGVVVMRGNEIEETRLGPEHRMFP
jgi:hypothetical protein